MKFDIQPLTIQDFSAAAVVFHGDSENTFTRSSLQDFKNILEKIKEEGTVSGLILASGNPKFFSSGLNLENIVKTPLNALIDEILEIIEFYYYLISYPLPLVSEICGHALGAGAIIALGSDYSYMLNSKGRFGFTEVHVGLPLPYPIVEKLKTTVHHEILNDIILLGKTFRPPEALKYGLVNQLAESQEDLRKLSVIKLKEMMRIDRQAFAWTKFTCNQNVIEKQKESLDYMRARLKNDGYLENLLSKIQSILERKNNPKNQDKMNE